MLFVILYFTVSLAFTLVTAMIPSESTPGENLVASFLIGLAWPIILIAFLILKLFR